MTELAATIITSVAAGGLIMAIWTIAHEAYQRRMDQEFYAGYMHGLNTRNNHTTVSPNTNGTTDAPDGKGVMRIGVHRP